MTSHTWQFHLVSMIFGGSFMTVSSIKITKNYNMSHIFIYVIGVYQIRKTNFNFFGSRGIQTMWTLPNSISFKSQITMVLDMVQFVCFIVAKLIKSFIFTTMLCGIDNIPWNTCNTFNTFSLSVGNMMLKFLYTIIIPRPKSHAT